MKEGGGRRRKEEEGGRREEGGRGRQVYVNGVYTGPKTDLACNFASVL